MTSCPLAPTAPPVTDRQALRWGGRIVSGLVIAFCLLDSAIKIPPLQPVTDTMVALGWPSDPATARWLAALLIGATLLYAYRPTAFLGGILMTAYLGGAVATHARIGSPLFTHTLFGVYVGVAVWGGLWLRDHRLRALFPFATRR